MFEFVDDLVNYMFSFDPAQEGGDKTVEVIIRNPNKPFFNKTQAEDVEFEEIQG